MMDGETVMFDSSGDANVPFASLSSSLPPPLFLGHLCILAIVLLVLDRGDAVNDGCLREGQLSSGRSDRFATLLEDAPRRRRVDVGVGGLLHGRVPPLVQSGVACRGADGRRGHR